MPTNAVTRNVGMDYSVTSVDNGNILFLGDASSSRTSVKTIQFIPGPGYVADPGTGWTVVARTYGPAADKAGVPFNPIPYRRVQLAGMASDRAVVSDVLNPAGFIIEVPLNGQTCAIIASCASGTGLLLQWNVVGSAT